MAEVNPRTIVVLYTGGPVLMNPWLDKAAAVVQAWFPGQEGGNAIADVLLGNLNINPPGFSAGEKDFTVTVSVDVRNSGRRKGAEVVQVYVKDVECSLVRPVKELKGFARVSLEPGEKKTISINLDRGAFAFYDPGQEQWVVEAGEFEIMVGSSSKDIRLKSRLIF